MLNINENRYRRIRLRGLIVCGVLAAIITILALVNKSIVIQMYFRPWCTIGLNPAEFGGNFRLLSRIGHMAAYAGLTFLLIRAAHVRLAPAMAAIAALAVILEVSQALTSTRTPHLMDLFMSFLGIGLGALSARRGPASERRHAERA
jgi:hypothetical protein